MTDTTTTSGAGDITITSRAATPVFAMVAVDLYRDIHKGIRAELFSVTHEAGAVDPADRAGRAALAEHLGAVAHLLRSHAEHEDIHVQPAIEQHLPDLARVIAADHHALEVRVAGLVELATATVGSPAARQRACVHRTYLELASFTSAYLHHQDIEERVVMPALEKAIGVDAVLAVHLGIVGSIPPEDMARSLAAMLPAMNVEDRTELLGGMQDTAPPEAFAEVWSLTTSVLDGPSVRALGRRLGVD
jgi:hypothetical protein